MWGRSQASSEPPTLGKASPVGGGSSAGGVNDTGKHPPPKLSDTPNLPVIPTPNTGYTLSKSGAMANTSKGFPPNAVSSPLQWSKPSGNPLNVTVSSIGAGDQQKTERGVPGNSARLVGNGGSGERASSAVASACGTNERGDGYGGSTSAPAVQASTSTEGEAGQVQTDHNSDGVNAGVSGERVVTSASNANIADSAGNPDKEISEEGSSGRDVTASDCSDKEAFSYDSARVCDAAKTVQAPVAPAVDCLDVGNWKPKPRGDAGKEASGRPEGGVRQGKSSITGAGGEGEMVNDGGASSTIGRLKKQPVATRFGGRTRTP